MTTFYYSEFNESQLGGGGYSAQDLYFFHINEFILNNNDSFSTTLPTGTLNTNFQFEDIFLTTNPNEVSGQGVFLGLGPETLAQTTLQSGPLYRFVSPQLAAQTINAQTWNLISYVSESAAQANMFAALAISVYNFNTSTLRGRIWNSSAAVGAEFPTSPANRTFSVSGSSVACEDGDSIVFELWYRATQGKATTYQFVGYFGDTTTTSQINCPQNLQFYNRKRRISIS